MVSQRLWIWRRLKLQWRSFRRRLKSGKCSLLELTYISWVLTLACVPCFATFASGGGDTTPWRSAPDYRRASRKKIYSRCVSTRSRDSTFFCPLSILDLFRSCQRSNFRKRNDVSHLLAHSDVASGGSKIWSRKGSTCQSGPPGSDRPLKLWWPLEICGPERLILVFRHSEGLLWAQKAPSGCSESLFRRSEGHLCAQMVSQEVRESFQRAPKYLLKLTDHSFGHSKGSFGTKGPLRGSRVGLWPYAPPPPLWIRHWT